MIWTKARWFGTKPRSFRTKGTWIRTKDRRIRTKARRFRTKARRVRNKLERVRIKINESEQKLARFEMKLGNPLIAQPFESLFQNLRLRHEKLPKIVQPFEKCLDWKIELEIEKKPYLSLRHGKIPKIVQPFENMFRLKNWIRNWKKYRTLAYIMEKFCIWNICL